MPGWACFFVAGFTAALLFSAVMFFMLFCYAAVCFFSYPSGIFSVAEGAKYYSIKLQPLFYALFDIFQRLSVVFSQTTFAPYFPQKKNYHISGWITSK